MKSSFCCKQKIFLSSITILTVIGSLTIIAPGQAQESKGDEIVDKLAAKTIDKFNNMSCADLVTSMSPQAAQAKDPEKAKITAKFLAILKRNPELKTRFFSQVSAPIVTKMFDCGLIPKQ